MFRSAIASFLAAAVCTAALAQPQPKGAATSLELNPHGIGHVLILPYFCAQGGNATLLSLFNAGEAAKAVKVRFRGAGNGDELFTFHVFLRGGDTWAANVSAGASGLPMFITVDRSCTLPAQINGAQFSTARLNPALAGDALASQAREGSIEIIAMGDVIEATPLATAISPAFGTPPCTPSVLGALARFDTQLVPPTTGLMANWILINVPRVTIWSGEAVAYEARLNGVASTGNNVFFPQTAAPLNAADVASYTSDPLYNFANGGPIVTPASRNLPDLSTPYTSTTTSPQSQATELSIDIAAQETVVEYLTDPAIQASTDWVVSMPTLRYHAAADYRGQKLITNRGTFGNPQAVYFTNFDRVSPSGLPCVATIPSAFITAFDREGNQPPILAPDLRLLTICGAVPVLSVHGATSASSPTLQASVTRTRLEAMDFFTDGAARLRWPDPAGLPVLVRQFSRAIGPPLGPGIAGTFGYSTAGRTLKPGVLP